MCDGIFWYLAQIHYLLCGGPISFRLLKREVMSQYLVHTTCKSHYLVQTTLVTSSKRILVYMGPLSRSQANSDDKLSNRTCRMP